MKPIFLFSFSIFLLFSISNCNSTHNLKKSEQLEQSLRKQIIFHVISLNEGNKEGLEKVYAEGYEGIFPVSKFESKEDLISQLVENQKKQGIKVEIEILEVSAKSDMAYAVLDWTAISNFGTANQSELYHTKHLQIWVRVDNNWQLTRSLFYN